MPMEVCIALMEPCINPMNTPTFEILPSMFMSDDSMFFIHSLRSARRDEPKLMEVKHVS